MTRTTLSSAYNMHVPEIAAHNMQAFAIVGLKRELGYVTSSAIWFGLWFPVMSTPVSWAYDSRKWLQHSIRSAQVVKWTDDFIRVHEIVWRILLTFVLYTMVGLVKAALGKYMSFHYHHRNHSAKMQVISCTKRKRKGTKTQIVLLPATKCTCLLIWRLCF